MDDQNRNNPQGDSSPEEWSPPSQPSVPEPVQQSVPQTETPPAPEEPDEQDSLNVPVSESGGFSASWILFGFFFFLISLIGIFYVVLLWSLLSGNLSNPIFDIIGLQPGQLKQTLGTFTNVLFGLGAFILLILVLLKLFQALIFHKGRSTRRSYFVKAFLFLLGFAGDVALWIWLTNLITGIATLTGAEIQGGPSYITTNPEQVVNITAPITVQFDVQKKLAEQGIGPTMIRSVQWDFDGDEEIDATGLLVNHRFVNKGENNGRFPVTAAIEYINIDGELKSFVAAKEVVVSNEAIRAQIIATPEQGEVPLEVTFSAEDAEDPDGEIILYEWDFNNDGTYDVVGPEEIIVRRTFGELGEFPVRLRVTGTNNDKAFIDKKIVVRLPDANLQAEINALQGVEGLAPFQVTLDGTKSFSKLGKITSYEWFVEGETESTIGRTIQRTFYQPGDYKVSLLVENDLGEKSRITKTISVLDPRVAVNLAIIATPAPGPDGIIKGTVPLTVTLDPSASRITDAVEWRWDFDTDGETDSFSKVATHTFRTPGMYQITLTALDAFGESYQQRGLVVVERAGVHADIKAEPSSGAVPLNVHFDGSGSTSDRGDIITYIWEFPGLEPIHYGADIDFEFKSVGIYTVKLTIVTDQGVEASDTMMISVRSRAVKADFKASPSAGAAPLEVHFDPSSTTGTVIDYFWSFGDGTTSTDIQPTHTYTKPGMYEVRFKIKDAKGIVSETKKSVIVEGPIVTPQQTDAPTEE